jgi:protein-disulfide isomerase
MVRPGENGFEMVSTVRKLAAAAGLIALSAAGASAGASVPGGAVVATVGSYRITEQQVNSRVKAQLASLEIQLYELKKSAVEQIADDYLLQQTAKRNHVSVAAYLKREVDSKIPPPTEPELHKLYDEGQSHKPYDQVKPSLVEYFRQQQAQRLREKLMAKLRAQRGLKLLLEAPRYDVPAGDRPALGPDGAPVTIVEFGDFENPYCRHTEDVLRQVRARYGNKVRVVYADFPLGPYPHSIDAALGARCAGQQGQFWPFHDALFADQSKLAANDLKATAAKLKLDTARFNDCFDKRKADNDLRKDMELAKSLGIEGTPAFFINGRPLFGAQLAEKFAEVIDEELAIAGNTRQARAQNSAARSP